MLTRIKLASLRLNALEPIPLPGGSIFFSGGRTDFGHGVYFPFTVYRLSSVIPNCRGSVALRGGSRIARIPHDGSSARPGRNGRPEATDRRPRVQQSWRQALQGAGIKRPRAPASVERPWYTLHLYLGSDLCGDQGRLCRDRIVRCILARFFICPPELQMTS